MASATSTVRDLCVLADKVDPGAVADRQLVTLLAGESARIRVRTTADVDPEAWLAQDVLLSANDLVARRSEERRVGEECRAGSARRQQKSQHRTTHHQRHESPGR